MISQESILEVCREIVSENGLATLNMRTVANRCGVALGSLYNYFSGKDELMLATIESVWKNIFHMDHNEQTDVPFPEYMQLIYDRIQQGIAEYPNFFTAHSISLASNEKGRAKERMEYYFSHMKKGMLKVLHSDPLVQKDTFSERFPESEFIEFVLSNLLLLLIQKKDNCDMLIEVIRRTIYEMNH